VYVSCRKVARESAERRLRFPAHPSPNHLSLVSTYCSSRPRMFETRCQTRKINDHHIPAVLTPQHYIGVFRVTSWKASHVSSLAPRGELRYIRLFPFKKGTSRPSNFMTIVAFVIHLLAALTFQSLTRTPLHSTFFLSHIIYIERSAPDLRHGVTCSPTRFPCLVEY
jgi:hypothetical protein